MTPGGDPGVGANRYPSNAICCEVRGTRDVLTRGSYADIIYGKTPLVISPFLFLTRPQTAGFRYQKHKQTRRLQMPPWIYRHDHSCLPPRLHPCNTRHHLLACSCNSLLTRRRLLHPPYSPSPSAFHSSVLPRLSPGTWSNTSP